jgi:hypothetical protein
MAVTMPVLLGLWMRVSVDVGHTFGVLMDMDMDAITYQTPQNIEPESHEHEPNGQLQALREAFGNHRIRGEDDGADDEQRERMTESPHGAKTYCLA